MLSLPDVTLARMLAQIYAPYRMPWYSALLLVIPVFGVILLWVLLDRSLLLQTEMEELLQGDSTDDVQT